MFETVFKNLALTDGDDRFSRAFELSDSNAVELSVEAIRFDGGDLIDFFTEESNDGQNWGGRQSVCDMSPLTLRAHGKLTSIASRYVRIVVNGGGALAVVAVDLEVSRQ